MAFRWERHYPQTRSVFAAGLMLFGAVMLTTLGFLWPQKLSAEIFNSRLAYHIILDIEDLWTCDKDYTRFLVDEPTVEEAVITFYLFNISNADDIIQRGYKPKISEVGPYSYRKKTYKYDVFFDPVDSLYVTFKEYLLLEEVTDPGACPQTYFRMGRGDLASYDLCVNGNCDCRSSNETLTLLNPLFIKTINDESTHSLMAQFSSEVFEKIRGFLEVDFVAAVKSWLIPQAYLEIFQFRTQMQFATILEGIVNNQTASGALSLQDVADIFTATRSSGISIPKYCGLGKLDSGLEGECPIDAGETLRTFISNYLAPIQTELNYTFRATDFPSWAPLFDKSWPYALVNMSSKGFSNWLGYSWQQSSIAFNVPVGSTMVSRGDMNAWFNNVIYALIVESVRLGRPGFTSATLTPNSPALTVAKHTSKAIVLSIIAWMSPYFNIGQPLGNRYQAICTNLAYKEFYSTYNPVQCAPLGHTCVWQWGYMKHFHGNNYKMSTEIQPGATTTIFNLLINSNTQVDTNPLHIYFLKNAAAYYNTYTYCTKVYNQEVDLSCPATDYGYTVFSGSMLVPASFYGFDRNIDLTNRTVSQVALRRESSAKRTEYQLVACNMSYLRVHVYPTSTGFHDDFVIRYINQRREAAFTHVFTKKNWKELGWAQFGGGFITFFINQVRAIYQMKRDAMWVFGPTSYWEELIEYGSWCIKEGYPHAWIYNVSAARDLLYALGDPKPAGVEFRRHLTYVATTFVGDGVNYDNGVGALGDLAFTAEANRGDFSCPGTPYESVCATMSNVYTSSYAKCLEIENDIFSVCRGQTFQGNVWVANCDTFQTSMSSPTGGIQCDRNVVFGRPHPYGKTSGNVMYQMLFSLTTILRLKSGLWCYSFGSCDYSWGGIVTTTRVRQMLFEGYSEPSVLTYMNLKHRLDGVRFDCVNSKIRLAAVGPSCPSTSNPAEFLCDAQGLVMTLPGGGGTKLLSYGVTPNEEYFAPYFEVHLDTGEMLWAFASSSKTVARAAKVKAQAPSRILRIINPHWAAYPALNSKDVAFQKFYQCQGRYYGGMPYKFNNCTHRLNTGRKDLGQTLQLEVYRGNSSIYWFDEPAPINGSFDSAQLPSFEWDGFSYYPYTYNGTMNGTQHQALRKPRIFHKWHPLNLELDQTMFIYVWEYLINLAVPISNEFGVNNPGTYTRTQSLPTVRYEEVAATWQPLRTLGKPFDSFGMPYKIPLAMASLERLVGFPLFAGTPHNYGNLLWGSGLEYGMCQGYSPNQLSQRTFIDYDPVTGKIMRQVVRQSVRSSPLPLHFDVPHFTLSPLPGLDPHRSTSVSSRARSTPTSSPARAAAARPARPTPTTRATAASPMRLCSGTRTAGSSTRTAFSGSTTTSTAAPIALCCCRPWASPSGPPALSWGSSSSSMRPTTGASFCVASTSTDEGRMTEARCSWFVNTFYSLYSSSVELFS